MTTVKFMQIKTYVMYGLSRIVIITKAICLSKRCKLIKEMTFYFLLLIHGMEGISNKGQTSNNNT